MLRFFGVNSVFMMWILSDAYLHLVQRWDRIRITGVDSGRILRLSFGPGSGPGVKNL